MSSPNVVLMVKYYKPNTDRDINNPKAETKVKKRNYYSSNLSDGNDYMKYIDDGIKSKNDFDYMEYMTSHEESSGVFSNDGILTKQQKSDIRNELRKTNSVIWDMVVSFSEDFKDKVNTYEDALAILNSRLPRFFKDNGMDPSNIVWFAGLHRNTDNKHIHISFFEKEPSHLRANKQGLFYHNGKLTYLSLNDFKVKTEEYLIGNKYFFETYRRNLVNGTTERLKKFKSSELDVELKKKLSLLYSKMPKVNVSFMSASMQEHRPLIIEIENLILKQNPVLKTEYFNLKKDLRKKDEEIKRICEGQRIKPDRYLLTEKYINDFHRRIGNKIIEYVKNFEVLQTYENKSFEHQSRIRKMQKRYRNSLLNKTSKLNKNVEYEANRLFEEYRQRLLEAEYQRLIEEGVIEAE